MSANRRRFTITCRGCGKKFDVDVPKEAESARFSLSPAPRSVTFAADCPFCKYHHTLTHVYPGKEKR